MADNTILSLDIGSSSVSAVIAEIEETNQLSLRGIGSYATNGVYKGRIDHPDGLRKSVERAIHRAQHSAGFCPSRVITNIPLRGVSFEHSHGIKISTEASGKISQRDQEDCVKNSRLVVKKNRQNILHVIPLSYKVDTQISANPVGLMGNSLEVHSHVVLGHNDTIKQLSRIFNTLDLKVNGIVYDGLGLAPLFLTDQDREAGSLLIDIGGQFTKVHVFSQGALSHAFIIPIGGITFTSDVAQCLNVTLNDAEKLKLNYGDCYLNRVPSDQTMDVTLRSKQTASIKRLMLCQILEARVRELLGMIIDRLPRDTSINTVVLSGNGAKLTGLSEVFGARLGVSVRTTMLPDYHSIDYGENPSALGLLVYAIRSKAVHYESRKRLFSLFGRS